MKKILIATVATAALAIAGPAFAQVTGDVTGTVQAQVTPQTVTDPLAQTTDEAQDAITETTDEAQAAAVAPPQTQAEVAADATMPSPSVSAEAAPEAGAEAEAAVAAPTATASAETAVQAAADMPTSVQEAVNDGNYTTDDLNRAQLAALQSPTQGSR